NLVLDDVVDTFESSRGTLTGKFLELVARARPLLAVTQPSSEMGPILASTKKGRICSTAADVHKFLHDVNHGRLSPEGNSDEIARYSKASQAAVLAGLLDKIVNNLAGKGGTGCLSACAERKSLKYTGWQAASATRIGEQAQ
ncbi:MAG: hypothetical protein JXM70_13245, partial [Pirellulales bacterium]|nr:hypothetical protein [Pirellulales bacterium]